MASWNKVKFYYDSIPGSPGALVTATSARTGKQVENIFNMIEVNRWEAGSVSSPQQIDVDLGSGKEKGADYLAIIGHNLSTAGATIALQFSIDGINYNDALTPFAPASDRVVLREFADPGPYRHWRFSMNGHIAVPFMSVCVWGKMTELDYVNSSFDPNEEEVKACVNMSYGGYVSGVHRQYSERVMNLRFEDADQALYSKIRDWWERNGLKHFFVAWEGSSHPDEVFFMRPEPRFSNPLKNGGNSRDITITLKGRKE